MQLMHAPQRHQFLYSELNYCLSDRLIYLAAALLIIGQIGGRYLFYAAMIITGVGLN